MRMKYCMQYRMLELQHIIDDKMHIYIPVSSSIMMCTIYYDMICMIYRCLLLIVYDLNIYCTSGKCKLNLAIHLAIKRQVDQCQCSRPAMVPWCKWCIWSGAGGGERGRVCVKHGTSIDPWPSFKQIQIFKTCDLVRRFRRISWKVWIGWLVNRQKVWSAIWMRSQIDWNLFDLFTS